MSISNLNSYDEGVMAKLFTVNRGWLIRLQTDDEISKKDIEDLMKTEKTFQTIDENNISNKDVRDEYYSLWWETRAAMKDCIHTFDAITSQSMEKWHVRQVLDNKTDKDAIFQASDIAMENISRFMDVYDIKNLKGELKNEKAIEMFKLWNEIENFKDADSKFVNGELHRGLDDAQKIAKVGKLLHRFSAACYSKATAEYPPLWDLKRTYDGDMDEVYRMHRDTAVDMALDRTLYDFAERLSVYPVLFDPTFKDTNSSTKFRHANVLDNLKKSAVESNGSYIEKYVQEMDYCMACSLDNAIDEILQRERNEIYESAVQGVREAKSDERASQKIREMQNKERRLPDVSGIETEDNTGYQFD